MQVVVSKYPRLTLVSDRLLDIYCQLTEQRHSGPDTKSPDDLQRSEDKPTQLDGRALSLR